MNKLLSYSIDFVSFLSERLDFHLINRVILFGSVVRNEANKDSDIDIFIDTNQKIKVDKIIDEFYKSSKFNNYWKLKGIENQINIKIGKLDEWKDLKTSIISNGKILYSNYNDIPNNIMNKTIFFWDTIKPESKRVLFFKRLFGYKYNNKEYKGLLEKYNGQKIGKGSIIVLSENEFLFKKMFKENKVTVKIKKIIEYS
jgi:predicted nucleotidyltransferase